MAVHSFTLPDSSRERSSTRERVHGRYQRHNEVRRDQSQEHNNISPLPEVVNPERREECKHSFKLFCEHYFPQRFSLRWSNVHLELLQIMESSVLRTGGQICYAFPRGMGKTSIAEVLAIWSLMYGHRRYVVPIAGRADLANDILKSIVQEFEHNDALFEDFPEVCYPVRSVERSFIRAKGQHIDGQPTLLEYAKGVFVFPTVRESLSSGSKIHCFGITGTFRGLKHTLASGEVIRPDLVIIDDPQSDKSAKSPATIAMRERVIDGAILGLAGPDTSITAVMPCTVIRPNDLAERFLNRELRPEWQGQRTKLLLKFPSNMELWNEYNDIRKQSLRAGLGIKPATEFYQANRQSMDEGSEVAWEERFDKKHEVSGVQSAMNIFFRNPLTFASEYQNEPLIESNLDSTTTVLSKVDLMARATGLPHRVVPASTLYITTGIDIQKNILYYLTVAWGPDFGGIICDYGTYPKQESLDGWVASSPPITLAQLHPATSVGPSVYAGLIRLRSYLEQPFGIEGSSEEKFNARTLIDAGWAESSESVFNFCRDASPVGTDKYLPSFVRGIGASMVPMVEWQLKQGEIRKWNSRILPRTMKSTQGRNASFDGNLWKSLIAERLLVPMGGSNGLFLHGSEAPLYHETLANHLTSEQGEEHQGRGRRVKEWVLKDKHLDNHWWDCLIMSAVAANLAGLEPHTKSITIGSLEYSAPEPKKQRKTLDVSRMPKVEG